MSSSLGGSNSEYKPVIVALDYTNADLAMKLVDQLDPKYCRVKVGKQLFTQSGPEIVKSLVRRDFDVFLDLKFHDIPATVALACRAAADLGVWMLNVHASGGMRMMQSARDAIPKAPGSPLLIAVSVLTSMNDTDLLEVGVNKSVEEQVRHLSQLAYDANLDGMVCSAEETRLLKKDFPDTFILITPGIRIADSDHDDQRRVTTPVAAIANGADYLVIGRSITGANDPLKTLVMINAEIGVS